MYSFTIRCEIGGILYHQSGFNAAWQARFVGRRVRREVYPGNRLSIVRE